MNHSLPSQETLENPEVFYIFYHFPLPFPLAVPRWSPMAPLPATVALCVAEVRDLDLGSFGCQGRAGNAPLLAFRGPQGLSSSRNGE